ncbi:hypothetical protein FQR65_LT15126 [Abscondita terminalis]|nr:hypothetical protein FQR65_LT15126 [Abscondita terminalis]
MTRTIFFYVMVVLIEMVNFSESNHNFCCPEGRDCQCTFSSPANCYDNDGLLCLNKPFLPNGYCVCCFLMPRTTTSTPTPTPSSTPTSISTPSPTPSSTLTPTATPTSTPGVTYTSTIGTETVVVSTTTSYGTTTEGA